MCRFRVHNAYSVCVCMCVCVCVRARTYVQGYKCERDFCKCMIVTVTLFKKKKNYNNNNIHEKLTKRERLVYTRARRTVQRKKGEEEEKG